MLPFAERNGKKSKPRPLYTHRFLDFQALPIKFIRRNIPDNHQRAVDIAIVHAFQTSDPRRTLHPETHFKKREREERVRLTWHSNLWSQISGSGTG